MIDRASCEYGTVVLPFLSNERDEYGEPKAWEIEVPRLEDGSPDEDYASAAYKEMVAEGRFVPLGAVWHEEDEPLPMSRNLVYVLELRAMAAAGNWNELDGQRDG